METVITKAIHVLEVRGNIVEFADQFEIPMDSESVAVCEKAILENRTVELRMNEEGISHPCIYAI